MSELRSTVDAFRAETLADLPDARIEEDFAELHRAVEQLEVERLRRLAEIERRRLHERDGFLSAAAWVVGRFRVAWGAAREHVRIARALDYMPETRAALDEGEVSMSAVRVLVAAREASVEAFERCERQLVEAARIHSVSELARVAAFWREAAEQEDAPGGEDRLGARRRLHASASLMGMVRVDGDLDPETGRVFVDGAQGGARRRVAFGRGRRPDAGAEAGRRARRDLPSVAQPRRASDRCRRTPARHCDGGCGGAGPWFGRRRARPRRTRRCRCRSAACVRRLGHAGRDVRTLGAARRWAPDAGRAALDAPRRDRSRSPVPLPRLRSPAHLVRCASRSALGRRRAYRAVRTWCCFAGATTG